MTILKLLSILSPIIIIASLVFIFLEIVYTATILTGSLLGCLVLSMMFTGFIFMKRLGFIYEGVYIDKVRINCIVIILCYILRLVFDIIKVVFSKWFFQMRKESAELEDWTYLIFFAGFIGLIELLPVMMLEFHLEFLLVNKITLNFRKGKSVKKAKQQEGLIQKSFSESSASEIEYYN